MNKTVQPAGNAKIAIAELQGLKRQIVTGDVADTAIPLVGVMSNAFLFSVIGIDGDGASLAVQVQDFTANAVINPVVLAVEGITLTSTDPVNINITGHGLSTGDHIAFDDTFVGTVELDDTAWVIDWVDADNFTLRGSNSANFTAYTSGGNGTTQYGELESTEDTSAHRLIVDTYAQP